MGLFYLAIIRYDINQLLNQHGGYYETHSWRLY